MTLTLLGVCYQISLSMHPISFGSDKIVRTCVAQSSKPEGSGFAFQAPARFGGKSHSHPHF